MSFRPLSFFIALIFAFTPLLSQSNMGGGANPHIPSGPCLLPDQRESILKQIDLSRQNLIREGILSENPDPKEDLVLLEWPLAQAAGFYDYGYHGVSNYVDHNSNYPNQITDFNCGGRTYDNNNGYNHQGTDYYLWPFDWYKMDNDVVEVVAAAPGTIIYKSDGNSDRSCSFNTNDWNAIYVQHADNSVAWYGHLKNGSITAKAAGQTVSNGEFLGIVGSSGNSTSPHLHFEVYDPAGNLVDPYMGTCNGMNTQTWWADQPGYFDSKINALMTHFSDPVFNACPNQADINATNQFTGGQQAYFAAYYRDQMDTMQSSYKVYQPDGTIWKQWIHNSPQSYYSSSYWYWWYTLPVGVDGVWKFEVSFEGEVYTHIFNVGLVQSVRHSDFPDHIRIYPNPASDHLIIEWEETSFHKGSFSLCSPVGQVITTFRVDPAFSNGRYICYLNELPAGLYLLRAEIDSEGYFKKIWVE